MMLRMSSNRSTAVFSPRVWKRYAAALCLAVSLIACNPSHALGRDDPDAVHYDARVQGYTPDVELKSGGTGMMWVVMILLGAICVSVIFKDAKRSHLD
jgi:hypothetical protein